MGFWNLNMPPKGTGKTSPKNHGILGSQNWWFGDPRTLLYRFKSLYARVQ